ncbi:extracellular matrix organizing protein FRAS1-like [Osmerus eperlanus]|uniref:extracellular matrix organizing protein FRAS1-like n=1 Tax=Osmerus eperlanus TaxID=29151 RepID=UPI002E0DCBDE
MLYAVKMSLRWILLAALAGIITITPGTQGACVHQGSQYQNNSTWRPQSCEECSCYGDVAVCTPARCPNPQCDFKRGEKLRIPPSGCCPECLAPSLGACQHEGAVYGDGKPVERLPVLCVCVLPGEGVLLAASLPSSQLPSWPEPLHSCWRVLPQVCPAWSSLPQSGLKFHLKSV